MTTALTAALRRSGLAAGALALGTALAVTGCGQSDPLAQQSPDATATGTIVVGSQSYYSNEIIAEIYAQALEEAGFEVERRFAIGQRDAYIPALEAGEVDVFPEYTGNLLEYYASQDGGEVDVTLPDEVYSALSDALPDGLEVLEMSPATDQDSYHVTSEFATQNDLDEIGDLAGVDGLVLGGYPELEERYYGPQGLEEVYGVTVDFEATGDATVQALLDGEINVANVYTADPRIGENDLVPLADPEGLFLASNVVPLVNADIADEVADVLNQVSAAMGPEELVQLNVQSQVAQESTESIATGWLDRYGFLSAD